MKAQKVAKQATGLPGCMGTAEEDLWVSICSTRLKLYEQATDCSVPQHCG